MSKVDIVETTLQDGTTGKCAYVDGATFTDFKMTIQKHLIEGNKYTISFLYKTNVQEANYIELLSGGYDVVQLRRTGTTRIGEWEKCQITFTSDGNYPVLYFPNHEYWMYALMVEEGTVASTWSASVNDTRVDTESIIDQKSESITIAVKGEVLEKVGEDFVQKNNVIAEINAQVDPEKGTSEVQINAGAINLNGVVTANETFKIDTDGSIEATGGRIGGLDVRKNGLSGVGFDLQHAEIWFDDDSGEPIVHKEASLILDGVTDEYGWNNTSQVEYTGLGAKSNYIDTNKRAFDLDIRPVRKVGRNSVDAKMTFNTIYYNGKEGVTETMSFDGATGEMKGRQVKTYSGANLDNVQEKVDGVFKSSEVGHASGSSSALPSVNISSVPDGSDIRIEVGVPIDNGSTVAWFSLKTKKPYSTSSADYLFNAGGYYYSNNYYGSVFVRVSKSRVTIDGSWSRAYYSGTTLNFKSASSQIYVYTEHL